MRHGKGNKKLGKPTDQRIAMLRAIVESLFEHEKIQTTDTRAKEAQRFADKIITYGKKGTVHDRRQALKSLPNKDIIAKVFSEIAPKYSERNGGYTRVIKAGFRRGDAAPMSVLELV